MLAINHLSLALYSTAHQLQSALVASHILIRVDCARLAFSSLHFQMLTILNVLLRHGPLLASINDLAIAILVMDQSLQAVNATFSVLIMATLIHDLPIPAILIFTSFNLICIIHSHLL